MKASLDASVDLRAVRKSCSYERNWTECLENFFCFKIKKKCLEVMLIWNQFNLRKFKAKSEFLGRYIAKFLKIYIFRIWKHIFSIWKKAFVSNQLECLRHILDLVLWLRKEYIEYTLWYHLVFRKKFFWGRTFKNWCRYWQSSVRSFLFPLSNLWVWRKFI